MFLVDEVQVDEMVRVERLFAFRMAVVLCTLKCCIALQP